jgi:hypothetical protein
MNAHISRVDGTIEVLASSLYLNRAGKPNDFEIAVALLAAPGGWFKLCCVVLCATGLPKVRAYPSQCVGARPWLRAAPCARAWLDLALHTVPHTEIALCMI